ncbi:MAG: MTH938/NDUFAF3 family protein [Mariprofundaceae bacterium]
MNTGIPGDISPLTDNRTLLFRGYGDDYLKLNERKITHSFILHHGESVVPWQPKCLADIKNSDFSAFMTAPPEVLLIGTGRITAFPDRAIMQALDEAHIGFECMDSRAAARTYNILIAEGRDVSIATLLPNAR